jgi:hypothetical protein
LFTNTTDVFGRLLLYDIRCHKVVLAMKFHGGFLTSRRLSYFVVLQVRGRFLAQQASG